MTDSKQPTAAVVGAGLVGICAGLSLLERGFQVQLIDRDPPAEGASFGNAGLICTWFCAPQSLPGVLWSVPKWLIDPLGPVSLRWRYLPKALPWLWQFAKAGHRDRLPAIADAMLVLNNPSLDLYRQLLAGDGHESLVRDSAYICAYRNPSNVDLNSEEWTLKRERGAPLELIDGNALREIEPDMSPDYRAAVVLRDQGRAVDPGRLGKVLSEQFQLRGGKFNQSKVHAVTPREGGGATVRGDQGEVVADKVVICAGAWSAQLLEPLGLKVPLEAERGYHATFANPGVALNNTVSDGEGKFGLHSMQMGLRCAGTVEIAGVDAPPDYRRAQIFTRLAKRALPKLNTDEPSQWMGCRPSMPDSVPCIGPLPDYPDIIVGFGHGHLGLTGAPMTGRIIAAVAGAEPLNIDLAPYRVDRFA